MEIKMKLVSLVTAITLMLTLAPRTSREAYTEPLPQTVIHDVIMDHLENRDNGKRKKVLLIGYDGFRADCLPLITNNENGAVDLILTEGEVRSTYAGGCVGNYQNTCTAAGWCSILTGKWWNETGVTNNKSIKWDEAETFLTSADKLGYKAAFISSYSGHFDHTLERDVMKTEKNDSGVRYIRCNSDDETVESTVAQLREGCDVVCAILEYTDAAGHEYGFSGDTPEYAKACVEADLAAVRIIEAAKSASGEDMDMLIIITTDHGGQGHGHGGQSTDERATFAVFNRKISEYASVGK